MKCVGRRGEIYLIGIHAWVVLGLTRPRFHRRILTYVRLGAAGRNADPHLHA